MDGVMNEWKKKLCLAENVWKKEEKENGRTSQLFIRLTRKEGRKKDGICFSVFVVNSSTLRMIFLEQ